MASPSLQNTTVLVTGAAGGLGKAIAKAYLDAGANVAICDIHEARLAEARAQFEGTGRVLALKTDITSEEAVEHLVAETVSRFGRLDILVNNAGMMDGFDPVGDLSKANWDKVLGVNLTGSFLCMKHTVRAFQTQQSKTPGSEDSDLAKFKGLVIQIGSNASTMGHQSGAAYTASKHGVAALVKNTAGFYGDEGVYAVALMLGVMQTNIAEGVGALGGFNQAAFAKSSSVTSSGENVTDTADVARYCVFLADPRIAAGVNGSSIAFNKNWPRQ
ncbi:3-beta-hydroxycholanate 3-dehydrogenase (NAD(+)) 2 [Apiospora aurea]|uniref:3-beta-hydroxycholanate 3-dehydrogenase (NAD(+)) 2 n=1 Tax=Apiospora aurea TaxID=335848 RepID=A0ABR1PWN7_9PEZI